MIIDHIKNGFVYEGLSKGLKIALTYIKENDLSSLDVGKYPLDGENVFMLIQEYEGKTLENGMCEAHRDYIDVQYIISGVEQMGYNELENMEIIEAYDCDKDRLFVQWEGQLMTYSEGMFAIFFPHDAHMPGIESIQGQKIKKAVFKVKK